MRTWGCGGAAKRTRPRRSSEAAKRRSLRRCRDEVTRTRPPTCSEVQTKPLSAQDGIVRGETRMSGQKETTTKCGGRSSDAPEWNIRGGRSTRGCRPLNWIIRGQAVARRHGLDDPARIKQKEPQRRGGAEEMQRWSDQDEAVDMQRSADEAMECPKQNHPGPNNKERPK